MTPSSADVSILRDLLSSDPTLLAIEIGMALIAVLLVFFILFTLRDSLLRTRSFLFQIVSILLVAALPGLGFLLYLLIRPARTIKEREMETALQSILRSQRPPPHPHQSQKKKPTMPAPSANMKMATNVDG